MAGPGICVQWEHFDPAGRRTTVLLETASTLTWKSGTSNMRVLLEIGGGSCCFLDDHTTARYNASALVHSILLECRGPHATRNHVAEIIRLRSRLLQRRRPFCCRLMAVSMSRSVWTRPMFPFQRPIMVLLRPFHLVVWLSGRADFPRHFSATMAILLTASHELPTRYSAACSSPDIRCCGCYRSTWAVLDAIFPTRIQGMR